LRPRSEALAAAAERKRPIARIRSSAEPYAPYDRHHSIQKVDGGDAVGPGLVNLKEMKFCLVERKHSKVVMLLDVRPKIDTRNWIYRRKMVRPFEGRAELIEEGFDFIKH
jgi:hypothetical protein